MRCVLGQQDTKDGPLCVITPEESGWYCAYVNNFLLDEADSFMAKKFRKRFRLPYPSYKDLHQIIFDNRSERWCGHKWNGKKSSPVELLLLGSLRYLGHDWTFDDIEEQTAILISLHHKVFHTLLSLGALIFILCMLSHRFILLRCNQTWQSPWRQDFLVVSDQQIVLTSQRRDVSTIKNNHLDAKSSHTTRTFNLRCIHRRQILHTTRGSPGCWNDMTMISFDTFLTNVRAGGFLTDNKFELLS
jgi:hypothetical protein